LRSLLFDQPACRVGCGSAMASPAFSGPRSRASDTCSSALPHQHRPGWHTASGPRMGPAPAGGHHRTTTSARCGRPRIPRPARDRGKGPLFAADGGRRLVHP
jgi:hypothetical protein